MELHVDSSGRFPVAALTGSMGPDDHEALIEALSDLAFGEGARLAIDLSGLADVNSSTLSALIALVTRARLTEGRVVLVGPSPFVRGVFNITRLDSWFDICDTLDDAARLLT